MKRNAVGVRARGRPLTIVVTKLMPYTFKITFPANPETITLCASSQPEADKMARALITLDANYLVRGPKWIEGSFRMTPAAYEVLDRLVPTQSRARRCAPRT
jgi:hypothetical protein